MKIWLPGLADVEVLDCYVRYPWRVRLRQNLVLSVHRLEACTMKLQSLNFLTINQRIEDQSSPLMYSSMLVVGTSTSSF